MVEGKNLTRVFVQDTVLDFPRLNVITRDNASVYIDSVLSFKVVNPKLMLYSCVNLQAMLSKLLQVRSRSRVPVCQRDTAGDRVCCATS
jgi:regulator of protease activity HflC (stomatin/prohibitin superfamily)